MAGVIPKMVEWFTGRDESVIIHEFYLLGITPCNFLKLNRRFGGSRRFHRQGRRISRVLFVTCFYDGSFLGLFFDPEDGGGMLLRNVCWLWTDYMALYRSIKSLS
jgi:hypothetical protein